MGYWHSPGSPGIKFALACFGGLLSPVIAGPVGHFVHSMSNQYESGQRASIAVELELPVRARIGDTVPITVRLRNTGREPAVLELQGRVPTFDVVVATLEGRVAWSRLRGTGASAILQLRTLGPGQSLELAADWLQIGNDGNPVVAGRYLVRGLVPLANRIVSTPTRELLIVR